MASIPTLFFDIGGVLLTNAWDTSSRRKAAETFGLDFGEFQTRHEMLKSAFETGRLSLDAYVRKAVFFRERSFTPAEFQSFMFAQSEPYDEMIGMIAKLKVRHRLKVFVVSNEAQGEDPGLQSVATASGTPAASMS